MMLKVKQVYELCTGDHDLTPEKNNRHPQQKPIVKGGEPVGSFKMLSHLRDTHLHATRVLFTTTHSTTSFPRHLAYEVNGPLPYSTKVHLPNAIAPGEAPLWFLWL